MCIPIIVATQQLGKYVPAETNTYATTELLDETSSMQSMPYQRKEGD
jgi:hypothetical protein